MRAEIDDDRLAEILAQGAIANGILTGMHNAIEDQRDLINHLASLAATARSDRARRYPQPKRVGHGDHPETPADAIVHAAERREAVAHRQLQLMREAREQKAAEIRPLTKIAREAERFANRSQDRNI